MYTRSGQNSTVYSFKADSRYTHQTQPEIRCMQYRYLLPEGGNIPKLAYSPQPKVV